jgi:glycerol-3-phosphate acyltransferase PlsY
VELYLVGCYVGLFVVSFLLGSIPWGVVISKLFFKKDIRDAGSGNIGTTNALRTLGKGAGAAVFVLDFGKGVLAGGVGRIVASVVQAHVQESFVAGTFGFANADALAASAGAICTALALLGGTWGHIFSPWLGFKGGKGIAVAGGALFFVFGPIGGVAELVVFAIAVAATRYVSVGSLAAAVLCPLQALYFYWGHPLAWVLILAAAVTVVWAHRANIARLRAHNENRLGASKKPA